LVTAVLDPSKANKNRLRGSKGEAQAASGLLLFLSSDYKVFNDLLIPFREGTSQIDHVVVSNYGIFAIESKNISGDIYGTVVDQTWTVCKGGSRFTFYNPLRQNAGHIRALMSVTQLPESVFHSLVFFWSDACEFKTPMPENVRQMGLCEYIRSKRKYLLSNGDVKSAISTINAARLKSNRANLEAHVATLKQRFPR